MRISFFSPLQYRDGAFICDLCKKSFSDGNDMVAHWKSHVKQQQQAGKGGGRDGGYAAEKTKPAAAESGSRRGRGRSTGRGAANSRTAKTHTTSRGRPITSKQAGRKRRTDTKKVKKGRSDKGKPRWTAYLVWSTRRRQEIKVRLFEQPIYPHTLHRITPQHITFHFTIIHHTTSHHITSHTHHMTPHRVT